MPPRLLEDHKQIDMSTPAIEGWSATMAHGYILSGHNSEPSWLPCEAGGVRFLLLPLLRAGLSPTLWHLRWTSIATRGQRLREHRGLPTEGGHSSEAETSDHCPVGGRGATVTQHRKLCVATCAVDVRALLQPYDTSDNPDLLTTRTWHDPQPTTSKPIITFHVCWASIPHSSGLPGAGAMEAVPAHHDNVRPKTRAEHHVPSG